MKKYLFTSEKFPGEIELHYDEKGWLTSFDIRASLGKNQHQWFLTVFPKDLAQLRAIVDDPTNKGVKLVEINQDVTFEMFWNVYNDKVNSSKIKARRAWQRMTLGNQVAAFNYISKYLANLPQGVRKKYAETYLHAELWNN